MIAIDTSLVYLTQYNVLNTRRVNKKAYESVDSYPEDYSTKGSTESASSASSTDSTNNVSSTNSTGSTNETNTINTGDSDLDAILKDLKLYMPENRFALLLQMKREDLVNMLFLLDIKALGLGLKYFSKDKLCNYIYSLPKEEIVKIATSMFSTQELLSSIPTKEMNKFLDTVKLESGELLKAFESLSPSVLAQIYEATTGEAAGKRNYDQFMQEFKQMDDRDILQGMKALPNKELLRIMTKLVDNNPKLLLQFSEQALCKPIEQSAKSKITEGMTSIKPEYIIKLLGQLPDKLLAAVDTMVPPDKFAEVLLKFNKNLLKSLAA